MKTDQLQNIDKNRPKLWNILDDLASWAQTNEVFEYSQMRSYVSRNRGGGLYL